jgi:hypothetical protein
MDNLVRIKRLVLQRKILFTKKAEIEMDIDSLDVDMVCEAIINAPAISKTIRSVNPVTGKKEHLFVILGLTYQDLPVYTKGKILTQGNQEIFYVLISSKRSV